MEKALLYLKKGLHIYETKYARNQEEIGKLGMNKLQTKIKLEDEQFTNMEYIESIKKAILLIEKNR
jgi:hypothetical protein